MGVVAVAESPGPDASLAARAGELCAALGTRSADVVAPEALRERMIRPPSPALDEVDRAHAAAVALHLAGNYDASNRALRDLRGALERLPEGPEVFAAWSRAMLRLARSEQELGRLDGAREILAHLLRADPDAGVPAREYPPSFQALADEERTRLRGAARHRLTVEAHRDGRVLIEGRDVGAPPVVLDLPPGRYRIAAARLGLRAAPVVVDLDGDRVVHLDLSAADALRPERGPGLALPADGRIDRAAGLGAQLGLSRLVLVSSEGEPRRRLVASLVKVEGRSVLRAASVHLEEDGRAPPAALDGLAAYVAGGDPSPLVAAPDGAAFAVAPAAASRILATSPPLAAPAARARARRLGWATVGTGSAAVAAGVVAAILGREAQSKYDAARAMRDGSGGVSPPHTVAEYNALLDRGDRQRRLAIGAGIGAGVCAAASAALGYWSWRSTGEIGPFRF